jgi:hypothetical protein
MTFRWEADACSAPALKIGIDRPYKSDATWNSSTEGDTAQRRHGLVTHGWHGNAGAMLEHCAALTLPDGTPFSSVIGTYTGDIVASPLQSRTVRFAFEMRLHSPYVHAGPRHRFISPAQDTLARDSTDARHDGTGRSVPRSRRKPFRHSCTRAYRPWRRQMRKAHQWLLPPKVAASRIRPGIARPSFRLELGESLR